MSSPVTASRTQPMERLKVLSDQAPIALVLFDRSLVLQALNPAAEALLGASGRTLLGHKPDEAFIDCAALVTLLSYALASGGDVAAPDIGIRTSLHTPELRLTVRIRNAGADGLVVALSQPMGLDRDEEGTGFAGMGRLLGHEVKNPLAGISGAAQLLLRRGREDDSELLELIRDEAGRIERLINRFSAFELYSRPNPVPVNVHELLDRVAHAEGAAFAERVSFVREYDPSLPDIPVDRDHLHEALLNVLRNGAEAAIAHNGERGAVITLRTAFELNVPQAARAPLATRRAVRIDIIDNGPGIDPARAEGLFDAFQSSKSSGRGLGLTIVKEVVSAHGGHVSIGDPPPRQGRRAAAAGAEDSFAEAQDARGTCVSIYLPIKRKARP